MTPSIVIYGQEGRALLGWSDGDFFGKSCNRFPVPHSSAEHANALFLVPRGRFSRKNAMTDGVMHSLADCLSRLKLLLSFWRATLNWGLGPLFEFCHLLKNMKISDV